MDARFTSLAVCLVLLLGACAGERPGGTDDPLAGQIFRSDGMRVTRAELIADAADAEFVLIGERRDNPEHHRLQAELVSALQARSDGPRAIAFQMIPADRQLEIVEYLDAHPDGAGLAEVVAWDQSGSAEWASYQPIAQAALASDAQIVGADLDTADKRAAFVQGAQAFRSAFVQRTGLGEPWPAPMMVSLQNELRAAHCDRIPGRVVIGMMRVQRARDAMMADRLAATSGRAGGVLIAENSSVRKDRGVPWYLARLRPGARSVSIGLLQVRDDMLEPLSDLPFDYVWFTPGVEARRDPCATQDSELERLLQAG